MSKGLSKAMSEKETLVVNALDRAEALLELGRTEQAIPLLSQALAHAPDDFWLHCRLADALHSVDQPQKAAQHAEQALRLNPNSDHALRRLAWLEMEHHNFDDGLKFAEAATRIDPDHSFNLYTLAWALNHAGKIDRALDSANRALKLNPEDADLHELIADLSFNKGKYKDAETHYREALRHAPEDASIHASLGDSLAAQRKINEASEQFLRAVKLEPAQQHYREKLFDIIHHEIMDQPLKSQQRLLESLDPAVQFFYKDQLQRKGWPEKIRIGSVVSLWLLALGVLMAFFTWATGEDPRKLIRFVFVVGIVYAILFIAKLVMQKRRR